MQNKKRNGFTLTELIVVIAIIGILLAVLIPLLTGYIGKAQVSNDTRLVRNLNAALADDSALNLYGAKHANMTEALKAANAEGYDLGKINASKRDNEILWDSKNDVFVYYNASAEDGKQIEYIPNSVKEGEGFTSLNHQLWRIKDVTNGNLTTEECSIYAKTSTVDTITTDKGFDAGKVDSITSVSYTHSGATQTVVIRTNGGALTINAKNDDVKHYGNAESVNVIDVATASYHENGKVQFLEVAAGHIVLEQEADVIAFHFTATNGAFKNADNKTISIDISNLPEEKLPDFSRDPVTIAENGTYVAEVKSDSTEYIWLFGQGIKEQMVVTSTEGAIATGGQLNEGVAVGAEDGSVAEQIANPAKRNDEGALVDGNDEVINLSQIDLTQSTALATTAIVEEVASKDEVKQAAKSKSIQIDENTYELSTKEDLFLFATLVNNGQSFEGKTVRLANDINLNNEAWTPIGTLSNPFSGKFDGQYHSIENINVISTSGYAGLFGEIQGTPNIHAMNLNDVWSNNSFVDSSFEEGNYTAVVKNLTIAGASVTETGSKKGTGALAGRINDAYIANIIISNSTITGFKAVGGISGCFNGSMAKNCTTLSDVSVVAANNGYHAGGLFGGVIYEQAKAITNYSAVVSCENNASVTVDSTGNTGGSVGGIVAWSQNWIPGAGNSTSTSGALYINCVNNGNVEYKPNSCQAAGGIAGFGLNAVAFVGCANKGNITVENVVASGDSAICGGIAGIAIGGSAIYNCSNSGKLTGRTSEKTRMAGVFVDYSGQGANAPAYGCTNIGELDNKDTTNGRTAQIAFTGGSLTISNQVYANVTALQNAIANNGGKPIDFINCSVTDKTGTLDLTGISGTITSDSKLCNSIIVTDSSVALVIPDAIITISGNSEISISSMGDGCTITIAEGATVNNVTVGGNGSSLIVNGSVSGITLAGNGNVSATISEGATAQKVGFGGTGTYSLTNRGTISTTTEQGNIHTVSTIRTCNITIDNYGTIEAIGNSYACLFYNGCDVVVNQYYGSSITSTSNRELVCSSAHSVVYNTYDANGVLTGSEVKK